MRKNANAESTNNAKRRKQLLREMGIEDCRRKSINLIGNVQLFEEVQDGVHTLKDNSGNNLLVKYQRISLLFQY